MRHHRRRENYLFSQIKSQADLLSLGKERVTVTSTWNRSTMQQVCVENFYRAEIPNSILGIRLNHSKLWLHVYIVLTLFNHNSHAKPLLHHIANTELASLLVPCCEPVAHNKSGGRTQVDKMILIS